MCRMLTAYMQMCPDDPDMVNMDMHKLVYSNYKRCVQGIFASVYLGMLQLLPGN
jgi:hypothetical protein